jgi:phosphohistidine swiveling domain-containing protein
VPRKGKGFLQNSVYRFPVRLTGQYIAIKSQIKGVSAGVAEGYLKTINDTDLKDNILYTELLTPDLTKYFGNITGIVSENGGMLSHLAIMAREQNIPVVVGFNPAKNGIQPGDKIKIDGNAGTVQKLPL